MSPETKTKKSLKKMAEINKVDCFGVVAEFNPFHEGHAYFIDKAREIAKGGVIGVNIMVATRYYEEYVKAAVKAGVDLIVSGAGLPTKLPEFVKNTKTKIAPIVSSVKSAKVICKLWDR